MGAIRQLLEMPRVHSKHLAATSACRMWSRSSKWSGHDDEPTCPDHCDKCINLRASVLPVCQYTSTATSIRESTYCRVVHVLSRGCRLGARSPTIARLP